MRKLTEGNITRQIILFMLPFLLGNALQRFYTLCDTMMVGRLLGPDALSSVGSAANVGMLLIVMVNGFTMGFSIITGQYFGAGNDRELKKTLAGSYVLSLAICIVLVIFGLIFEKEILVLINVPADLLELSSEYLRIIIWGLFASLVYNLMANMLRSLGDSIVPLVFLAISSIMNIGMDYCFMKYLNMGVSGAALATVISQSISGIACVIFCLFKRKEMIVSVSDFSFRENKFGDLMPQGISMSMMLTVVAVGSVILQSGINSLGKDVIAGYTAGRKYLEFFMLFLASMAGTASAFTSQNYGAKKYDRIISGVRQSILISWGMTILCVIAVYAFGREMVTSITRSDVSESIISPGIIYLKSNIPIFIFLSVLLVGRSVLQGMNKKKTPVVASVMELIVKIIAVKVFVPMMGFWAICIAEPIIWILGAFWVYPVFVFSIRKLRKMENQ